MFVQILIAAVMHQINFGSLINCRWQFDTLCNLRVDREKWPFSIRKSWRSCALKKYLKNAYTLKKLANFLNPQTRARWTSKAPFPKRPNNFSWLSTVSLDSVSPPLWTEWQSRVERERTSGPVLSATEKLDQTSRAGERRNRFRADRRDKKAMHVLGFQWNDDFSLTTASTERGWQIFDVCSSPVCVPSCTRNLEFPAFPSSFSSTSNPIHQCSYRSPLILKKTLEKW